MTYEPFTVLSVPFPFVDKNQSKRRPAVVLSSKEHQQETKHITLLMITSARHTQWSNDYLLTDLKSAGLSTGSVIRQKIFTIDARLIIKAIGKIAIADQKQIIKKLNSHLSF